MFTGIIEDVGTVRDIDDRGESMRLRIDSPIIDGADHTLRNKLADFARDHGVRI